MRLTPLTSLMMRRLFTAARMSAPPGHLAEMVPRHLAPRQRSDTDHPQSRRQRGPDHPREIGAEVGLRQQQHAGVEPAMMHNGVFGIARRVKDLEPRASRLRLDRELAA